MICFERTLPNRKLTVFIEEDFYLKYKLIFDSMLCTFNIENLGEKTKDSLYIFECDDCYFKRTEKQYIVGCNTLNEPEFLHHLRSCLEEWFKEVLKCTILHGSSLNLFGKNFLFLGEKKSGKTTLTNYLIHEKDAVYLDDDSVYILDNKYYGFNLPLYLRGKKSDNEYVIGYTVDYDKVLRTVIAPPRSTQMITKIDYIIFPKYNNNGINCVENIERSVAFNKVIKNVKSSVNLKSLFADMNNLIREPKVFFMSYENSQVAYKQLLFLTSR